VCNRYDFSICSPGWQAMDMESYEQCVSLAQDEGIDELICTENLN
jgi:hypothetical protein